MKWKRGRSTSPAVSLVSFLIAAVALGGCGAHSYAGISLRAGAADPQLQELARRAQAGDKDAQLNLGIRFEEGRGVRSDLRQARRLYRLAAAASPSTQFVYVPAADGRGRSATVPLNTGPDSPGLTAAQDRLERIERAASADGKSSGWAQPRANRSNALPQLFRAYAELAALNSSFAACRAVAGKSLQMTDIRKIRLCIHQKVDSSGCDVPREDFALANALIEREASLSVLRRVPRVIAESPTYQLLTSIRL